MAVCYRVVPEGMEEAAANILECRDALQQIVEYANAHCTLEGAFGLLLQPIQPIHNAARDAVMDDLTALGDALNVTAQSVRDSLADAMACEEGNQQACRDLEAEIDNCGSNESGSEQQTGSEPSGPTPPPTGTSPGGGGGGTPTGGGGGGMPTGGGGAPSGGGGAPTVTPPVADPEVEASLEADPEVEDPEAPDPEAELTEEEQQTGTDEEERPEGHPVGCRCEACDSNHPVGCRCGVCDAHPVGCRCENCGEHPMGCQCEPCLAEGVQQGCPPSCTQCRAGEQHVPDFVRDNADCEHGTGPEAGVNLEEQWENREPIRVIRGDVNIVLGEAIAYDQPKGSVSFDLGSIVAEAYGSGSQRESVATGVSL